ncbi:MAG TPA: hypothetical protein VKA89_04935 [Solirubrobacterales bacterium]|nr:hypothetical protein [Solirubrobacterales bacterium]
MEGARAHLATDEPQERPQLLQVLPRLVDASGQAAVVFGSQPL